MRITAPTRPSTGPSAKPPSNNVVPKPTTSGAMVGRGISTEVSREMASLPVVCGSPVTDCALAAKQINDAEHEHPHHVHKMPIPRDQLDADLVGVRHPSPERQPQHDQHRDYADGNVQPVKTDERIVRGAEQVAADRQPV